MGRIIKPYGVQGKIKFQSYNQDSRLLNVDTEVWLKREGTKNSNYKFFKINLINYNSLYPIVRFKGIDDREDALKLRNFILYIPRSLFPKNKKNEIYFIDFIGCKVYDKDKSFIGLVKDISHLSGDNNIIIVENNEKEYMLPIKSDFIKLFDFDKKHIIIDIIDGLLDN